MITIGVQGSYCTTQRTYIMADSKETAKAFALACIEWNSEVRGEVLVFSGGWHKDEDLFQAIQKTTLASLVLEGNLKQEIEEDFRSFLGAREVYAAHGIPWKRGVLLLGPPGNGKTHAIKGLINLLRVPCLYVRTFEHPRSTPQEMIRQVFKRARTTAPCLLVLEDLDSILNDGNRSYFVNELDGFASNEGILTIATTNHPERLDPAILDRPSRFDRKYTFNLPDEGCRIAYLALQNQSLEHALRMRDDEMANLAAETQDFSYAYLKELLLSSMMRWIAAKGAARMGDIMRSQVACLKAQMMTPEPVPPPTAPYRPPGSMQAYEKMMAARRK